MLSGGLLEGGLMGRDVEPGKVGAGSSDGLEVHQRQAEPVDLPATTGPRVGVGTEVPVAADDPAEIATPIVRRAVRRRREPARAHQLAVQRQMRSAIPAMLGAGDVLPSAVAQEPVVAAGDKLRPVLQGDPVGGLDRRPVVDDVRGHIPAAGPVPDRSVDGVPGSHVGEGLGPAIRHQNWSVTS
jgi:hypothetical protein